MMDTHRIGIIADTHDLLRPEVLEQLNGCERILHAGDISSARILEQLRQIAPVHAVKGNNDHDWAEDIPSESRLTVHGLRIYMTHKKKDIPDDITDADLVIYGHSHRYEETRKDGSIWLNPGSCGPRRFHQPITMALLTITDDGFEIEKIDIPHAQPAGSADVLDGKLLRENPGKLVEQVVAEVQRGRSVAQIAQKLHISTELAESICRMYLTHPGVTTEGILRRIGY